MHVPRLVEAVATKSMKPFTSDVQAKLISSKCDGGRAALWQRASCAHAGSGGAVLQQLAPGTMASKVTARLLCRCDAGLYLGVIPYQEPLLGTGHLVMSTCCVFL